MGDLTPLGDEIKRLPMMTNTPNSPSLTGGLLPTGLDPRLSLLDLRPTTEIIAAHSAAQLDLDRIAEAIRKFGADADGLSDHERHTRAETRKELSNRQERATRALERIDGLLDKADERDRLSTDRPEGCWCLGLGWKGERYVPDGDGGGIPVPDQTCTCPEGRLADAQKQRIVSAYLKGMKSARLEHYFRASKLPHRYREASFASYPVSPSTAAIVEQLQGYAAGCGQEHGRSLYLWGQFGVGKTGLAAATMRAAREAHGIDALFTTVPGLLDEIRNTYNRPRARVPYAQDDEEPQLSTGELQRLVRNTSLLILDDIGTEQDTPWVEEELFKLINHRYVDMRRTIFTSNLDTVKLAKKRGPQTAWRVVEMADVIHFKDAPNLRLPGSKR